MATKNFLGREEDAELEVVRASGSYLFNQRGRRFIDFLSGWCVGNLGWNHHAVNPAMRRFRGPDYVFPEHGYRPWDDLARRLCTSAPGNLKRCFRATGGSEAVELALQGAMLHTGRGKFLSFEGAYHGNTIGALSLAGADNREKYPNLLSSCDTIAPPLDERALDKIHTRLKRRDVAALIMEPVSINLGVVAPLKSSMQQLQQLCRRYGTLLIMDEVACGFFRTGTMFATEQFAIQPDMMCIGKAVTNGALGLGAMMTTAEVGRSLEEDGSLWSTFGWHPRSVAAAMAIVSFMTAHRRELTARAATMSAYFHKRLLEAFDSAQLQVRGMAMTADCGSEARAEKIRKQCLDRGVVIDTLDERILLLPAITIPRAVAARGLDQLVSCANA